MSAYCRVSTDEEKQLDSLAHQKTFFVGFATENGHNLVQVYADEGISGKQLKKREEFRRMLRDAELGCFELLAVKDVSRFARNTVDLLTAIRKLKSLGIEVLFLSSGQRVLGESEFILTLFGAMAQEESANLSKRVKFGKDVTAKQGRVPPRIFGYDRIDNFTLQINQDEATVVRIIFQLYTENGLGYRRIAQELKTAHQKTKFGLDWDSKGVRRILSNPIYCGRFENHKYTVTDFLEGTVQPIPPEAHYWHDRPEWAIISPQLFQTAEEKRQQRRGQFGATTKQVGYSGRHLFSTIIRCGVCGSTFTRRSYTYVNTRVYWKCTRNNQYSDAGCTNHVSVEDGALREELSRYFHEIVGERSLFEEKLWETFRQLQPTDGNRHNSGLQEKQNKLTHQQEKYREMYANDLIGLDALQRKLQGIGVQLSAVERQMSEELIAPKTVAVTTQVVREVTEEVLSLQTLTNPELRTLLSKVCVDDCGQVTITIDVDDLSEKD